MTYKRTMLGLGIVSLILMAYDISMLRTILGAVFGGLR